MIRGNVIGKKNYPNGTLAPGVWSLQEQYLSSRATTWPITFEVNQTNLVLYLDAALTTSYAGTGTTWTDLSGNGANGTLVNGPTYSSTAKSFTFDGTDDRVDCTVTKTTNCTFSCWAKATTVSSGNGHMLFIAGADGAGPDLFFYSGGVAWNSWDGLAASFGNIPASVTDGKWHHYAVVTDVPANNTKLYYDGSLYGTTTYKAATSNTILRIGGPTSTNMWSGQIGLFTVNNTALSAAQVAANYNGQKARFG